MGEIRIWRSFASNNSSDFRLVARFVSAEVAKEVAGELRELIGEVDERGLDAAPGAVQQTLAERYGFTWPEGALVESADDHAFGLATHDKVLVAHHDFCLGGLERSLGPYLRARGGQVDSEEHRLPTVTVRLELPLGPARETLLEQLRSGVTITTVEGISFRWRSALFYHHGDKAGAHLTLDASAFDELVAHLEDLGVSDFRLALCDESEFEALKALARTRECLACRSAELVLHEVVDDPSPAEDQLACSRCGAMFSMSSLAAHAAVCELDHGVIGLCATGTSYYALEDGWGGAQLWRASAVEEVATSRLEGCPNQALEWVPVEELRGARLTAFPANAVAGSERIYCYGRARQLDFSEDGGESWRSARWRGQRGAQEVTGLCCSADGLWLCGTEGLIAHSDDGESFVVKRVMARSACALNAIVALESPRLLVAVGAAGHALRSSDGETWERHVSGVGSSFVRAVVAEERILVLDQDGQLHASDDRGLTWLSLAPRVDGVLEQGEGTVFMAMDLWALDGEHVVAVDVFGRLLSSWDAGQSWTSSPLHVDTCPSCLTVSPEGLVIVGCEGGAVVAKALPGRP